MISCFSVFLWSINIYFPPIVVSSSFVNLAPPLDQGPGAKPDSDALLRYWRSARKGFPVTMFGDNFDRYLIGQLTGHFQGAMFYSVAHQYNTISYFQNFFNIQTIFLMQHFRANIEHHFFATFSFVDIFKTLPRCNICKPMLTLLPFPFNKTVLASLMSVNEIILNQDEDPQVPILGMDNLYQMFSLKLQLWNISTLKILKATTFGVFFILRLFRYL